MLESSAKLSAKLFVAGKNEFVSQFTCLQPHLYKNYKRWKNNKQSIITARRIITSALDNDDEQHFN